MMDRCALTSEDSRNRTTAHETSTGLGLMGVNYRGSLDPVDLGNPGDEWRGDDNNTINPVVTGGAAYLGIPRNDGGGDRMNTCRTGSMDFLNTASTVTYDVDAPSTGSRYSNGWCDIELGDSINNLRYSSSASATSSTWDSILTSITASICLGETNPSEPSTRGDLTTIVPPNTMVAPDIRAWLTARLFNNGSWGFTALFFETLKNRIFSCCMLKRKIPPITIESEPVPEFVICMDRGDQAASHEPALPITPVYIATPATPNIQNTDTAMVIRAPTNKYTTTPPKGRPIPRQTPNPKAYFTPETTKHRSPHSLAPFQDYVFPLYKTLASTTPLPRHPTFPEPFETVYCTAEESHYAALCALTGTLPNTKTNSTTQPTYSSPDAAITFSTNTLSQNPHSSDSALYTTLPEPIGPERNSALLYSTPSVITNPPPPSTEHADTKTQSSAGIDGFTHPKLHQTLQVPVIPSRGTTAIADQSTAAYGLETYSQPNADTEILCGLYNPQNKLFVIQEEDEEELKKNSTQTKPQTQNPTQDSSSEDSDSDGEQFTYESQNPFAIRSEEEHMIKRLEELCAFFDTVGSTHGDVKMCSETPLVAPTLRLSAPGVLSSRTHLCESSGGVYDMESGRRVGTECYRQSWLGGCATPPLPVEIAVEEELAEWCESDYYDNFL